MQTKVFKISESQILNNPVIQTIKGQGSRVLNTSTMTRVILGFVADHSTGVVIRRGVILRRDKAAPFVEADVAINNNSVRVLKIKPEIPVGGRLTHFVEKWKSITTDQWQIDLVVEGYKLEFNKIPKFQGAKETHVTSTSLELISLEVKELLAKGCIEHIPVNQIMDGFYSTFFLVKRKQGTCVLLSIYDL